MHAHHPGTDALGPINIPKCPKVRTYLLVNRIH